MAGKEIRNLALSSILFALNCTTLQLHTLAQYKECILFW